MTSFLKELEEVCKQCGRKREEVQVVYATKYLNPEQLVDFIKIAQDLGIEPILIGENRVQEAEEKMEFIKNKSPKLLKSLKWIMIGNLQKNKVNKAIEIFEEIHSVDSLELARAINMRLASPVNKIKVVPIFLEVNVSEEETKHGVEQEMIDEVVKSLKLLKSLKLEGLMTMAPHFEEPEEARPIFKKLRQLANRYQLLTSMGMSNDWKQAVEEGADYIRIGGRIFQS